MLQYFSYLCGLLPHCLSHIEEPRTGHRNQLWPHQCWSRGRITSLKLLAVLFPVQLRVQFILCATKEHNWLGSVPARTHPGPFLPSCFPARWGPAYFPTCAPPGAGFQTSHWTSWGSCQLISAACHGPSQGQHDPVAYQSLLPVLLNIQITGEDIKQDWTPVFRPVVHHCLLASISALCHDQHLQAQLLSQFSIHLSHQWCETLALVN